MAKRTKERDELLDVYAFLFNNRINTYSDNELKIRRSASKTRDGNRNYVALVTDNELCTSTEQTVFL